MAELCIKCGKRGDKKCGRCKRVTYCSQQCQAEHWKAGHKGECKLLSETQASAYIPTAPVATLPATSAPVTSAAPASATSPAPPQASAPSTWQANERPRPPVEEFLFPPKRVQQMMSFQSKEHELTGSTLTNVGNSCFVNSVLQCLTYTRPLMTAFLRHDEHDKACKKGEKGEYCLWCIMQSHVREAMDPRGYVQITPRNLLLNLPRIGMFQLGVQEDAHEFFLAVLSGLQSSILATLPKKVPPSLEDTTLLYQIFGGCVQSQVRCKQCSNVSCRYEPFLDLNLELSSGNSIEEALSSYTSIEELGKDVGWKCDKCEDVAAAQKQLTIYDCPNILSIQLKRFDLLHGGIKSHKSVVFREDLDLRRVVSFNRQHQDARYELYGIIVHYGQTIHAGHYVAFVKVGSKWHLYDDMKVTEVNPAVVLQQSAYMLFYRKQSVQTPEEIERRRKEEAEKEKQKATAAPKKKKALKHSTGELLPPPPHRIFYQLSPDNAISNFTVRVDLPAHFSPDKATLSVSHGGALQLSSPDTASLSLSLPLPLTVSRTKARYFDKDLVLAVELHVEEEKERLEREQTEKKAAQSVQASAPTVLPSEQSLRSEESSQRKKTLLSSSATDIETESTAPLSPIEIEVVSGPAQLHVDPECELEIARPSSPTPSAASTDAEEKQKEKAVAKKPAAQDNTEKATYSKLYADLRNAPSAIAAPASGAAPEAKVKVGRNNPCPCGSGKKYKNCHG